MRRTQRLPQYDYRASGAYFVTCCLRPRRPVFGRVTRVGVHLSPTGYLADGCWEAIPVHHPHVRLDAFVVMPDHIHGLLWIEPSPVTSRGAFRPRTFGTSHAGSLSVVIGTYKAAVTRSARRQGLDLPNWQPRFYEHIVRNERALHAIRRYIRANPQRWFDRYGAG
ncbi:MAG: transposase [Bacteroidota bacterium]